MYQIELSGSAFQRGQQHGESLRVQIQELAAIRKELVRKFLRGMPQSEQVALALAQVRFLKKYPELYDEFRGISESSHVSEEDLAILNNYTDMRDFYVPDQGCSVFGVKTSKAYLVGQTWDMHGSATPYVLRMKIKDPIPAEILTVTGCFALAGVNANGVGVLINNVHSRETKIGLMWPALVRLILQQKTAQEAKDILIKNLPCSGHHYLIFGPKEMYSIETTGKRYDIFGQVFEKGLLFHTNHYLGKLKETEIQSRLSGTTHPRFEALDGFFQTTPLDDLESFQLEQALKEMITTPLEEGGVFIPPDEEHPDKSASCSSLLIDLSQKKGIVFSADEVLEARLEDAVKFQF